METKISEIPDRAACAVWCPMKSHPHVMALGGKDSGGTGFEEKAVELELYQVPSDSAPVLLGSIETPSRFSSIAWTPYLGANASYPMGLLVGGMTDGHIHVWDPRLIMENKNNNATVNGTTGSPLICTIAQDEDVGPISALKFSALQPHQLCAGAAKGHVKIVDFSAEAGVSHPVLSEPAPGHRKPAAGEVTAIGWNTQVPHIVATASGDGTVTVWDLNSRKAWCEIRAEHTGQAVADLCWNPTQGLHLLTASADDRNPFLRVWDLAASTSMPLATLQGHTAGLLKTDWCPHDDALLLSCGKDNRTLLWDLTTMQPIAEVPLDTNTSTAANPMQNQPKANAIFSTATAISLNEQKHMRYDCQWSPYTRGVALTCSFDRKVQVHAVMSLATRSGRPPAWLRPASAVSCGFGGTIVSCSKTQQTVVKITTAQEEPILAQTSQAHESELASKHLLDFCRQRQASASDSTQAQIWAFLRIVFESNARREILLHLGFNAEEIAAKAASQYGSLDASSAHSTTSVGSQDGKSVKALVRLNRSDEEMINKSLLVGNFEAAVEVCFASGNLADALILASCGGGELWSKTQERYFASESPRRPFLSIVSAVIRNQLDQLVAESDVRQWKETLAILSTYGQSEEFPRLCVALGDRLEEAGDLQSASLCYTCALNLERTVRFWKMQLEKAHSTVVDGSAQDLLSLHDFVVKVSVLLEAVGPTALVPEEMEQDFAKYAQALADQGLLVTAAKYIKGTTEKIKILRDRLYRSRASHRCLPVLGSAPEFPFQMVSIGNSQGQVTAESLRQQAQQQQHQNHQHQQVATQQQQQHQTQSYAAPAPQPQSSAGDQLPAGWIALQDPSSGQYYYANQQTGEVTWDRPQAPQQQAQAPAYSAQSHAHNNVSAHQQQHHHQQNQSSYANGMASTPAPVPAPAPTPAASKPAKSSIASKYGDGFVSSSSHPELANQYGNVGTSNPYGAQRPGTAAAVVGSSKQPPVSGTMNLESMELSPEQAQVKETLLSLIEALQTTQLFITEKKQLAEAEKAVAILVKKMVRSDLDDQATSKVYSLVGAVSNRDFASASSIQAALAATEWREHKDWLKGIKSLVQISLKKLN